MPMPSVHGEGREVDGEAGWVEGELAARGGVVGAEKCGPRVV